LWSLVVQEVEIITEVVVEQVVSELELDCL
jgi:hypothetical protein